MQKIRPYLVAMLVSLIGIIGAQAQPEAQIYVKSIDWQQVTDYDDQQPFDLDKFYETYAHDPSDCANDSVLVKTWVWNGSSPNSGLASDTELDILDYHTVACNTIKVTHVFNGTTSVYTSGPDFDAHDLENGHYWGFGNWFVVPQLNATLGSASQGSLNMPKWEIELFGDENETYDVVVRMKGKYKTNISNVWDIQDNYASGTAWMTGSNKISKIGGVSTTSDGNNWWKVTLTMDGDSKSDVTPESSAKVFEIEDYEVKSIIEN